MNNALLTTHLEAARDVQIIDRVERCFHCLESLPKHTDIKAQVNGVPKPVCCYGCQSAAEFISQNELNDFYRRRNRITSLDSVRLSTSLAKHTRTDWSFLENDKLSIHYIDLSTKNERQLTLDVKDVYCSSCAWLINKALAKLSDNISVNMDVSAKRLFLKISDSELKLSKVLEVIENLGYQPSVIELNAGEDNDQIHFETDNRTALKRIAVAGFGMMQVMTYATAMYFGDFQGMEEPFRRFLSLVSLLVATAVVFYAGKPFFTNALNDLRNQHLGMDVPIALAIAGAYFPSVYQTLVRSPLQVSGEVYFDSAVMFIFFLSVGRYISMRAKHRLSSTQTSLTRLLPPFIKVSRHQKLQVCELQIKPQDVKAGDVITINAQQILPFDGVVMNGEAYIDESLLSGESTPVYRKQSGRVVAGSLIKQGKVEVKATHSWQDSSIAKIERLLTSAQLSNVEHSGLMQQFAKYFVFAVLFITTIVACVWWVIDPTLVFVVVLSMLVASCPCAFSLAAPIGAAAASKALRLHGLLLANYSALKKLPDITTWCFDKTGTITQGMPVILEVKHYAQRTVVECLSMAAAIERENNHVLSYAFTSIGSDMAASNLSYYPGKGVSADILGEHYFLGKPSWVRRQLTSQICDQQFIADIEKSDCSVVALATANTYLANFFIGDSLRSQSISAINALKLRGSNIAILSGDRQAVVNQAAQRLRVNSQEGDLSAEQKQQRIKQLQSKGEVVAMVGDGVNDAPVSAQADVSIVMANGSELTQSQADVIVLNGQLDSLSMLQDVAIKTKNITHQNIIWALAYNLIALPLAAFGMLTPWMAALGMSVSSLLVVLNAVRISKHKHVF